jgi:molecular chaperone GrpE
MEEPTKEHSGKSQSPGKSEGSKKGHGQMPGGEQAAQPVIAMSIEEYDAMKSEHDKAVTEAASNMDGWQRERAEFSNYKRRIDRDQAQLNQAVTGDVIKKYLVVLDDLELALKNRPHGGHGAGWAEGIQLIVRKLQAIIDSEGIERINQNRVPFDPNMHEAISNEENSEFESGEVIEIVRQGYKLGDRILRPAMVRVAR